jgi:signal transduction histidine kinase/ActR/RegA family two-component response regulator
VVTQRVRLPGLRRLLPEGFLLLDQRARHQWLMLLTLSAAMFTFTLVGSLVALATGTFAAENAVISTMGGVGYGVSLVLQYRMRSHALAAHVMLATLQASIVAIMLVLGNPWLFAAPLGTLAPIIAVQLLDRRAALWWTFSMAGLLVTVIIIGLTGVGFTEPKTMLGSHELDLAFLGITLSTTLLILAWFHEGSRTHIQMASSFKSAVLACMSHELRTPLNGVLGMLENTMAGPLDPAQRENLAMAHRAGGSLLDIVDDALDLFQAESGGLQLQHEPFDLRAGLSASTARAIARSERPGVEISLRYPQALPSRFIGDGRQVLRMVDKLVDNALKFTDRGHVRIHVEYPAEPADGESTLTVRVEDTGIGIPAKKQAVIFDDLTQLDDSWNRTRGGTGMGLAVCRELVQRMGGRLGMHSELGRGTEIWFSIPIATAPGLAPAPEPEPVPAPASEAPRQRIRTLVVEDNLVNQVVAKRMLERLGCEVEVVGDGRQALERVRRDHFDIVFMDIQMPVMDGFEATIAIRDASNEEVASLPIVAMTAFTMAGDRGRCLDVGMNGYVGKPIDRQRLASELSRLTKWPGISPAA